MRVILTSLGENMISVIQEEKKSDQKEMTKSYSNSNHRTSSNNIGKNHNLSSLAKININSDFVNKKTRSISIHQNKIVMPKIMTEKYQHESSLNHFLPNLPELLNKRQETSNNNIMQTDTSNINHTDEGIKFKDILRGKAFSNLKMNIIKDKKYKDKLSIINENNFRSVYKPKSEIELIEDKLENSFIGSDKMSMIKYIYEKDNVSKHLINRISSIDEQKQNKLNKICHVLYQNKERDHLGKMLIDEKMKANQKKVQDDMENIFDFADHDLNKFKSLADCYKINNNLNKRSDIFMKRFKDMQNKFWKRFNANHLQRKINIEKNNKTVITDSFINH